MTSPSNVFSAALRRRAVLAAAVAAGLVGPTAWAGTSTNSSTGSSLNDTNYPNTPPVHNPAVTISMSGSTALRNFTTGAGFTFLDPGTSIILANGPGGALTTYTATNDATGSDQLASIDFTKADTITGPANTAFNNSAIRLEWHEQGSVEGILDMASDQIGYIGTTPLYVGSRNPTVGNPIWVNRNKFTAPGTITGHTLNTSDYNTYSNVTYNLATGQNLQGGQNRVQIAQSDVNANQGFAISGANGAMGLTPLVAGYGKGNNASGLAPASALSTTALATPGTYYQLQDQSVLNMSTSKNDPQTGAAYTAGPWNSAGLNNLTSTRLAVTATLFAANPGTGLTHINRSDAQWLQTTSRLANGAEFNMTTRDVGSGTRNVAAVNTGVDPAWAVGKNDAGNGNDTSAGQAAQDQLNIGPQMLFSNKTAGGGQLRPTIQNNRMAVGTLGMSDAIGSVKNNLSATPLRGLDYQDATTDGGNANGFVRASATSITNGQYVIYQNENLVTVKAPNAAFAGNTPAQWANLTDSATGIKGDNSNNDVAGVRANVINTIGHFPAASVANAADQLLAASFILPQMMQVEKTLDGVNASTPNVGYNSTQHDQFLASSYANNFAVADPSTVTTGSGATYGAAGNNAASFNGSIPITAQNYLFGNFNQTGTRDYSAVQTALTAAKAMISSGAGNSMFTADGGSTNSTAVHTGVTALENMNGAGAASTKGDLIVLGDINGDGKFDGKDLYLLAHGQALSDASGPGFTNGQLTAASGATFGDQVRNGVLRKNAALDYLQANTNDGSPASIALRQSASRNTTNDPNGLNAFNRYDVAGTGQITIMQAAIIDHFNGKSPFSLSDQLAATINTDKTVDLPGAAPSGKTQIPISLIDVSQFDGASKITSNDVYNFQQANPTVLKAGDANFNGSVGFDDFTSLSNNYGIPNGGGAAWHQGDFNGDGGVGFDDFTILSNNYGRQLTPAQEAQVVAWGRSLASNPSEMAAVDAFAANFAAVPEPATLGILAMSAFGLLARRRRQG